LEPASGYLAAPAPRSPSVFTPGRGCQPLLLARDFGWLGEAVVLHEGSNAGDSIAGLKDGKLNAACLTLDEVLSVRASGCR
jgi:NitT/TauT family transport system substrate-binding protein